MMGQNILKCEIIEVKDNGITKVKTINCIFVTSGHVAYVPREVVANCFGRYLPFFYQYRAIIL